MGEWLAEIALFGTVYYGTNILYLLLNVFPSVPLSRGGQGK